MVKLLITFFFLMPPALVFSQDCSGKIKAARTSKTEGNYRKALAQFTAAASSCDEARSAEIEREILDIYDRIEKLRNDAENAKKIAAAEAEKAKAAGEIAQQALIEAQKANQDARAAFDTLKIALSNLGKANAECEVRLLLAEVERNQREMNFSVAVEKARAAKALGALPEAVDMTYRNLNRVLLTQAREDLQHKEYKPALTKVKGAAELNVQPDSVTVISQALQQFIFENVRLDILNTGYDKAVEKISALRSLQVPVDTIESLWFEIAFCYTETGRLERAVAALDTLAQIRQDESVRAMLPSLVGKTPTTQAQLLRQIRRQLDPNRDIRLAARYYAPVSAKIPAGTLVWGNDQENGRSTCQIAVKSFSLASKEVTFFEYDLFCAATNRPKPSDNHWGREERPVINVNWYDAVEYCNWRSRQEGFQEVYGISAGPDDQNKSVTCNWDADGYRLPTETEWEYAAGNGQKHTRYGWGDGLPTTQRGGNVSDETTRTKFPDSEIFKAYSDGYAYTSPVGSFSPNDLGLYDVTGNVFEWCWDGYEEDYCRANRNKNVAPGAAAGSDRVARGGSWLSYPKDCIVGNRFHRNADTRNGTIGFRLARN